jgi:hypothetical protein
MNAEEIDQIAEGWASLTTACISAIRADKTLLDEEDRWLPVGTASEIQYLEASVDGLHINGSGSTYTMQTGGSTEHFEFRIPLDTLNKYL